MVGIMIFGVQLIDMLETRSLQRSNGLGFLDEFSSIINFRFWAFRCLFPSYDYSSEFWLRLAAPVVVCLLWLAFCHYYRMEYKARIAMMYHYMDTFYFPLVLSAMSPLLCAKHGKIEYLVTSPVHIIHIVFWLSKLIIPDFRTCHANRAAWY